MGKNCSVNQKIKFFKILKNEPEIIFQIRKKNIIFAKSLILLYSNMWVARDKDGNLKLFYNKPFRLYEDDFKFGDDKWITTWINWMEIDSTLFPDLTWDDEPIEVELVRKN